MNPYFQVFITAICSATLFVLGLILGLFVDKSFAIIAACFPIPLIIYGIINDRGDF